MTILFLWMNDFVHAHGITAVLKYRSKVLVDRFSWRGYGIFQHS